MFGGAAEKGWMDPHPWIAWHRPCCFPTLVATMVFLHACTAEAERWTPSRPSPSQRLITTDSLAMLGRSVEGRPVWVDVLGSGDDVVLLLATIHGQEWAGTPLLGHLAGYLQLHPELLENRRVVILPAANPDGFTSRSRYNARRVDLNRNFPADNRKDNRRYGHAPLSEPESRAIVSAIQRYRPDRIVTIHQPAACVDYDGPADELAAAMAEAGKLPVRRLGTKPGSLGAYAGEMLGISVVTLELPSRASGSERERLWELYGPMLIEAITYGAE